MQLNEDNSACDYHIKGYSEQGIQVNDRLLTNSFIITPSQLHTPWPVATLADVTPAQLQTILEIDPSPSLVLLGTGDTLLWPSTHLLDIFYQHHIGVEVMTTPAACRTYNLLAAEGRRFVCAMIV